MTFGQAPTANFSLSESQLCQGECITITNNSAGNPINFEWTFQNGTPETYNGANPGPVCFNTPGTECPASSNTSIPLFLFTKKLPMSVERVSP